MKQITIKITEKEDSDDVNINLDMKENKKATKNENVAASNVYHMIENSLKELENIKKGKKELIYEQYRII